MTIVEQIALGDLSKIQDIGSECLPLYYTVFDLLAMMYLPGHHLLKVVQDQNICGFIIAKYMDQKKRLHIMSLGVLPKYRRQGLATLLIDHLKQLDGEKLSLYVVEDNYNAIKFYAKMGFKSAERIENYYQSLNKSAYFLVYKK